MVRGGVELVIVQQSENKSDGLARCEDEGAFMVMRIGIPEFT